MCVAVRPLPRGRCVRREEDDFAPVLNDELPLALVEEAALQHRITGRVGNEAPYCEIRFPEHARGDQRLPAERERSDDSELQIQSHWNLPNSTYEVKSQPAPFLDNERAVDARPTESRDADPYTTRKNRFQANIRTGLK